MCSPPRNKMEANTQVNDLVLYILFYIHIDVTLRRDINTDCWALKSNTYQTSPYLI
jgi:hypothetical protein